MEKGKKKYTKNDKIKFIQNVINVSQSNPKFQNQISELLKKELEKKESDENLILNKISGIENVLDEIKDKFVSNEKESKNNDKIVESNYDPKHNPKEVLNLLQLFETQLKYFTHKWEKEEFFDKKSEIEKAKKLLKYYYTKIPTNFYARINAFLTKNSNRELNYEWFVNNLFGEKFECKYSWDNPKFNEWYNNSITKDITSPEIDENMILPFKNSIQIRDGNFKKHIEPIIKKYFSELYVTDYKNLEKAKFYVDVQALVLVIKKILETSIYKWAKKNDNFKIEFEYLELEHCLKICHLKSECHLKSDNPNLFGGDTNSLKEAFLNLCNWSVEAKYSDGYKRINLLTDKTDQQYIENLNYEVLGYTHILYFPKL